MRRTVCAEIDTRTVKEVPEGDTIHYAANRIRPVLEGHVPDEIRTPHRRFARDRWPERLAGQCVRSVDARGKHLMIRFEGGLTIHSHLRMTGSWQVVPLGAEWRRHPRRAWLVMRRGDREVIQFDGPVLDLMTDSRTRLDQRIAGLGPDVVAPAPFDEARLPAAVAPRRPDAADRRHAARPARRRRHGHRLALGGVLASRGRSLAPDVFGFR